jgi:hypothetical protein
LSLAATLYNQVLLRGKVSIRMGFADEKLVLVERVVNQHWSC